MVVQGCLCFLPLPDAYADQVRLVDEDSKRDDGSYSARRVELLDFYLLSEPLLTRLYCVLLTLIDLPDSFAWVSPPNKLGVVITLLE